MHFKTPTNEKPAYSEISSNDDLSLFDIDGHFNHYISPRHACSHYIYMYASLFILAVMASSILGYLFGKASTPTFGINPKTPVPLNIFDRHPVTFNPDERYIGSTAAANYNWNELTKGSNEVYVAEPAMYNLTDPGYHAPFFQFSPAPPAAYPLSKNFYILSPLHQLHCVHMIRARYNQIVYFPAVVDPLSNSTSDSDWRVHLDHCFEYLRLSITCGDFFVLESDSPPGTPDRSLGWGVVHQCIDWDGLVRWQEQMVDSYNATWSGKV